MSTGEKAVGKPIDRVDGRLKVTGQARYQAEAQVPNVTYGVLVTSTIPKGKIAGINPKTAHSQAIGGIVGGLGMALLEETVRDRRNGRVVNANLADYHVPVHADIPPLDAFFVEEHDPPVNPLGAKGLAELSLVGVAPAVANAVYHATGRRVRDLPITPEKLL
jgi:xanthine dehydrogenase YagR molybdenum-binding subunit